MPLPPPHRRAHVLQTRRIVCEGFERADGLYDIDGWLTDVKGFTFVTPIRGELPAGEFQHGLGMRVTIDSDFMIKNVIAVMDATPSKHCLGAAPNFAKLIGLKLVPGFNRTVDGSPRHPRLHAPDRSAGADGDYGSSDCLGQEVPPCDGRREIAAGAREQLPRLGG